MALNSVQEPFCGLVAARRIPSQIHVASGQKGDINFQEAIGPAVPWLWSGVKNVSFIVFL
jgi:hypothetical protein